MNVEYMYGDKKYKTTVPKLQSRDEFTKLGMSKPMASKAQGGYLDYNTKLPSFELGDSGDKFKGKSNIEYPDYSQSQNSASANIPRVVNQGRNKYTGNNVELGYYDQMSSTTGTNGRETFDSRPKFVENELAKSKQGGMIGKTIQYKKGGQVKSGKIIGISKTGKYIVK
jgi:hypothetical protein